MMRLKHARVTAVALVCLLAGLFPARLSHAAPRLGRAVIVDMYGEAEYETPYGAFPVEPGMALTHSLTLRTSGDSGLCAVLTPGAVLCVDEETELQFDVLEHTTAGLPSPETGNRTRDRITMNVTQGAVLVNAGEPGTGPDVEVRIRSLVSLTTRGGRFTVGGRGTAWRVHSEDGTLDMVAGSAERSIDPGDTVAVELKPDRAKDAARADYEEKDAPPEYEFHTCREYFRTLEPIAFDWRWAGLDELQTWMEGPTVIALIGNPGEWEDVTPTRRVRHGGVTETTKGLPPEASGTPGGRPRWEMWDWYHARGEMRGVNYIPRTAVNPTEMWQKDTFDPDTIDEELEWAARCGYNSVRVFLPYVVWKADADGLKERIDSFLELADDHNLSVVPVLFDDVRTAGRDPYTGPQAEAVPGVHNSQWTPSPGHGAAVDRKGEWDDLEKYVRDMTGTFGDDERIVLWDLYNQPGHSGMGTGSLPLLEAAFTWAREEEPDQPLTATIEMERGTDAVQRIMDLSDVLTFHAYEGAEDVASRLLLTQVRARPVLCTGWLRRSRGNTFTEVLPVFAKYNVGWFQWGLVAGRTQMNLPWDSKPGDPAPERWEQSFLDEDGEPYDKDELKRVRTFAFEQL